ncbi:hypothetical protein ACFQE5_21655 [Pseudonocardia hispaniensis]|uniref:Uncharacterized protein n=1 Tax=Pseudonocardia hispaniensis TaxID=904933 RepID=A0ABW1J7F6_9PSEU
MATVAAAGALLVGLPAVGWAAGAEYRFDATRLGNQRLPADPDSDFAAPAVSNGLVTSDLDGTACDSTYGVQLVRDRDYLPDEVVHRYNGRACDGPATQTGVSWSRGRFHFDARVTARQESQFGQGFVRAHWLRPRTSPR